MVTFDKQEDMLMPLRMVLGHFAENRSLDFNTVRFLDGETEGQPSGLFAIDLGPGYAESDYNTSSPAFKRVIEKLAAEGIKADYIEGFGTHREHGQKQGSLVINITQDGFDDRITELLRQYHHVDWERTQCSQRVREASEKVAALVGLLDDQILHGPDGKASDPVSAANFVASVQQAWDRQLAALKAKRGLNTQVDRLLPRGSDGGRASGR